MQIRIFIILKKIKEKCRFHPFFPLFNHIFTHYALYLLHTVLFLIAEHARSLTEFLFERTAEITFIREAA